MSRKPLREGDVLRVIASGRSLARKGSAAPLPNLTVIRTETHQEADAQRPGNWSQVAFASAPGVGSFRFTWGPTGGEVKAFGVWWDLQVHKRGAPAGWLSIDDAPKNARWVIGLFESGAELEVHWASDLSGEEQPPFRGWFARYPGGGERGFYQTDEPVAWKPVAEPR